MVPPLHWFDKERAMLLRAGCIARHVILAQGKGFLTIRGVQRCVQRQHRTQRLLHPAARKVNQGLGEVPQEALIVEIRSDFGVRLPRGSGISLCHLRKLA